MVRYTYEHERSGAITICRIWGISYNDQPEVLTTAQIARILFPALTQGGPHAFGWVQNLDNTEANHIVRKYVGRADHPGAMPYINSIRNNCKWIIGHTRFATHGSPAFACNDHPIRHGNIIGVHNGVLSNHADILSVTGRHDEQSEVDSEAIFAAVNRWGHKKGLAKIQGSMVTVYADFRKMDTVMIGRSYGRSLSIGWTERGNLIWASDKSALDKLEKSGVKFVKFSVVSEDRLLTIVNGEIVGRVYFRQPWPKANPMIQWSPQAAKAIGAAHKLQAPQQSQSLHYRSNNGGGMTTRERWETHPDRDAIEEFLNPPQGNPFMEQIAQYLARFGFLTPPQIARVIEVMTINQHKRKPKKNRKKHQQTSTQVIGKNMVRHQGRVMTVDEYVGLCRVADREWETS